MCSDRHPVELSGVFEVTSGLGLLRRGQKRFEFGRLLRVCYAQQKTDDRITNTRSSPNSPHASPIKLQCCLHLSRRPCLINRPKSTPLQRVRALEVSFIELVEHIHTALAP